MIMSKAIKKESNLPNTNLSPEVTDAVINGVKNNLIIGPAKIEKFLGRSFVECLALKSCGYPIIKRGGFPTINLEEHTAWMIKHGLDGADIKTITPASLKPILIRKRIAGMESRHLCSLQEIAEFIGHQSFAVISWLKDYPDCPITKKDRIYSADGKDLLLWMLDNSIPWRAMR
jgi:hypothetical protein